MQKSLFGTQRVLGMKQQILYTKLKLDHVKYPKVLSLVHFCDAELQLSYGIQAGLKQL